MKNSMAGFQSWLRGLLGGNEEPGSSSVHAPTQSPKPTSFAQENNDFALAMYGHLRQQPGNLFFSPFSIRAALGMTLTGARGETATQLRQALLIQSSDESFHQAYAKINARLNDRGGEYEMAVANSLWGQEGEPLLPEFLDRIARHYGGGMNLRDFRHAAEAARKDINRWVDDKTRQKIRDLIPSGSLSPDTRLVLVNAVYFKGMWESQFHKAVTREQPFHLEDGGTVQIPLMRQTEQIRYMQTGHYQAVDLRYRGGDLSMLVMLPKRKNGLGDLEQSISRQMLHGCVMKMTTREVKLILPRFKITWGTINLSEHLKTLGLQLAFARGQADFSGMNGIEPPSEESLFISSVFHKAFVDVNEEGTEAAAATAARMPLAMASKPSKPPRIPTFRADHPFLFAIRDRGGAILFLGRITDPTAGS
jgi:serpin B